MTVMRATMLAGLSGLLGLATAAGQLAPKPAPEQGGDHAAGREAAMKPALSAMGRRDYSTALDLFHALLTQYPKDARVAMLAGRAAWAAGNLTEAASDLKQAADQDRKYAWRERLQVLNIDAALGDWDDFERQDAAIHAAIAKGAAEAGSLKDGYLVELFIMGSKLVEVREYPELDGEFHARYRFFYGSGPDGFKRHLDVESDDADQPAFRAKHPEEALAGKRSFSLDDYPATDAQALILLYLDGEPKYAQARQRALRVLGIALGGSEARPVCPFAVVQ